MRASFATGLVGILTIAALLSGCSDPTSTVRDAMVPPARGTMNVGDNSFPVVDLGGPGKAVDVNDVGDILINGLVDQLKRQSYLRKADGTTIEIPAPCAPLVCHLQAEALNNRGQVVGTVFWDDGTASSQAFEWSEQSGFRNLTPGRAYSYAMDINDRGEIVGAAESDVPGFHAFVLRPGDRRIRFPAVAKGTSLSTGWAINREGDIVGRMFLAGGYHGVLWPSHTGGFIDLGTLGGPSSSAEALNDRGQVVGTAQTGAGEWRAFVWSRASGMIDLGEIGGYQTYATGINDSGQIVGGSWGSQPWVRRVGGSYVALPYLDPARPYASAEATNRCGDVVGIDVDSRYQSRPVKWAGGC